MFAACWLAVWEYVISKNAYILPVMPCRLKSTARNDLGEGIQLGKVHRVRRSTKGAKANHDGGAQGYRTVSYHCCMNIHSLFTFAVQSTGHTPAPAWGLSHGTVSLELPLLLP